MGIMGIMRIMGIIRDNEDNGTMGIVAMIGKLENWIVGRWYEMIMGRRNPGISDS